MKKIVESRCEVCGDLLESDISSGCTTCLKREMLGLKKIETQSTVPSGISRGSFVKKFALWTLSGFVVWFFIVQMTKEPVRHGGFRDEKTAPMLTEHERIIKAILDSPVDPLQPEGELSKIFRYFSEYTVLRRRRLPCQVDSLKPETFRSNTLGRNAAGGTSPRDSCGRYSL